MMVWDINESFKSNKSNKQCNQRSQIIFIGWCPLRINTGTAAVQQSCCDNCTARIAQPQLHCNNCTATIALRQLRTHLGVHLRPWTCYYNLFSLKAEFRRRKYCIWHCSVFMACLSGQDAFATETEKPSWHVVQSVCAFGKFLRGGGGHPQYLYFSPNLPRP